MGILDNVKFTPRELIERGKPLPEALSAAWILNLWTDDERQRELYLQAMVNGVNSGDLKVNVDFAYTCAHVGHTDEGIYVRESKYGSLELVGDIVKADFIDWLQSANEPLPEKCLLSNWFSLEPVTQTDIVHSNKQGSMIAVDGTEQGVDSVAPPAGEGKEERACQLHELIWRIYKSFECKTKAMDVWKELKTNYKTYDLDEIVQEITVDGIAWLSQYGNENYLKKSSFSSLLSKLKKDPPF